MISTLERTVLCKAFFTREDVLQIARDLLGKVLVTNFNRKITSGVIVETEAYAGVTDKASHAYSCRNTPRTAVMFGEGGVAYVYLCYGIHSLFNVVTNISGVPHAVLIRGIKPIDGIPVMLSRSGKNKRDENFGNGPGKVSKILGIHYSHTGKSLLKKDVNDQINVWLEDRGIKIPSGSIISTPRIGVDYAGEDARLPYRFFYRQ